VNLTAISQDDGEVRRKVPGRVGPKTGSLNLLAIERRTALQFRCLLEFSAHFIPSSACPPEMDMPATKPCVQEAGGS